MKKIYMSPEGQVIKIETVGMIAVSGFNKTLNGSGGGGEDALGRDYDFDFDEAE